MNDFFLALSCSIYVDLFGIKALEIRQITVEKLEDWLIVAQPIKEFLKDKDYSDAVLEQLFLEHGPYVIAMCALVTHLNQDELIKLAKDQPEFIRLMRHLLTVNQAYFKEKTSKKKNADPQDTTWFDSFQALIRRGHTHSEILKLSYGAFLAYLKAANKAYRSELVSCLNVSRLAHHGDAKAIKTFVNDLRAHN
ncbi:hypothetical protein [Acinetobacter sp. B51(2017)]|uniref:hypothetical protein n=1 Tax=Acinetobacter sp. B51(2017) TaxID=2060938 RepID=UPI000F084218|nr:hypothetical protein [Acinetobacter sp. B51(2017)]